MSMDESVVVRMEKAYAEKLGQGWTVTLSSRDGWDFYLKCKKGEFEKVSVALEAYKSVQELTVLAETDCANILLESEQQKVN